MSPTDPYADLPFDPADEPPLDEPADPLGDPWAGAAPAGPAPDAQPADGA
ncbi:hypothetical protein GJV82_18795, partial [Cellulosimicrobium sp. BIT-GX5]|nr:hypothetical protein [Cellulosimicrobium composti]